MLSMDGPNVKELKSLELKNDTAMVRQDERLEGKYLVSNSDQHMSAEDNAPVYKKLLDHERMFRALKGTLCLCPVI